MTLVALLAAVAIASHHGGADGRVWSAGDRQFEVITVADGLSDSTVFAIAEDPYGRLWFGTGSGGVNLYDGYRIETFWHTREASSLSHSDIATLLSHSAGRLYVGTWGGGLNRLRLPQVAFDRINSDHPPDRVQVLFEDRAGTVWVGSSEAGLFRLGTGDQLENVAVPGLADTGRIWSLAQGADGDLWVATDTRLLRLTDDASRVVVGHVLPADHPRALHIDADDRLWIGGNSALYRLREDGASVAPVLTDLPTINTLADGGDGLLLIGTFSGLYAMDVASATPVAENPAGPALFANLNIRDIHRDRGGILWLATREAGVVKLHPPTTAFDGYSTAGELGTVSTIVEVNLHEVVAGSRRGLWHLTAVADTVEAVEIPGTSTWTINCLAVVDGVVLVGTRNGIFRYDPVSGAVGRDPRFAAIGDVTVIEPQSDGSLWIGTWGAGAFLYPAAGAAERRLWSGGSPALPDDFISAIYVDQEDVWIGHWNEGLSHVQASGRLVHYHEASASQPLPLGPVHAIAGVEGAIYAATSFGFARINPRERTTREIELGRDGLPVSVKDVLRDRNGDLWISTTRGLRYLEPDGGRLLFYGAADGLQTTEFLLRAGAVGNSGRVYFGGVGGFVSFDPDEVPTDFAPPAAVITAIDIDGATVSAVGGELRLAPGAREIGIHYRATDNKSPRENQYQVRMVGLNDDWTAPQSASSTRYYGLDPGRYEFRVRAANSNGVWSEHAARVEFVITPHWWQTWLGRGAAALVALALVYAWHRLRTARILAINRRLETRVAGQMEALRTANRRLQDAALTDYLTGLPNRRGFTTRIEESDQPGFIALGDIDNFKSFNDRFGHDVGDVALQHVAQMFRRATRAEDLVGRWGGEEFIFFFAGGTRAQAIDRAERIRESIAQARLEVPGVKIPQVTITIGVANLREGESLGRCVARADKRLYYGKQTGKNRVVAEGPVESGE